jgi:ribosomal protein L32
MAKKSTPKKQTSNSQAKCRYKAFQNFARKRLLDNANLTPCPKCGERKPMHTVCHNCGEYNGRQVINMEKKVDKITKVKA